MQMLLRLIWRVFKLMLRTVFYIMALFVFLFLVQRSTYPTYVDWNAISLAVSEHKFDYLSWELEALWRKTSQALWGQHAYMTEAERSDFVRDYMDDLARVREMEAELDRRFLENPDADVAELQAERDRLRDDLAARQGTAEAILEGQVAAVLADAGFGTLGQLLPPVSMHFTRMPNLLVVSPRDSIKREVELALDPMTLREAARVEDRVEATRDVSALVVPLGGMALFPAMIQESASIPWAVKTFAHEWVHHYFFFFPLGTSYFVDTGGSRDALTINETAADIFGQEVADRVLRRYYPEHAEQSAAGGPRTVSGASQDVEDEFEFGSAMHETRVTVDSIMATVQRIQSHAEPLKPLEDSTRIAKVEATVERLVRKAERYMDYREAVFNANGYNIRELNQAYFAFYGGYQGSIPGIGGEDPIGPAVRAIHDASPDLHSFVVALRGVTTTDELLAVRDQMVSPSQTAVR